MTPSIHATGRHVAEDITSSITLSGSCQDKERTWVINGETELYLDFTQVGWGLFAARPFVAGEHVLTFAGPILNQEETLALGAWSMYPLQIDSDRYVHCGPPGAFVNHQCEPSCRLKDSVKLVAHRDLQRGDEITMDYSCCMSGDPESGMGCLCGGLDCRRQILNFEELPESLQAQRVRQGMVSAFISSRYVRVHEILDPATISAPLLSLDARIPTFPSFASMSLTLSSALRDFAATYPPFNDFSVLTLHCFDDGQPKLSQLNENLVLRLVDPATNNPYLTLLGINKITETVEALKGLTASTVNGLPLSISAVPELVVSGLPSINWAEQEEFSEYIFSIQHWLNSTTANLMAKKRRAERFLKSHNQVQVTHLNLNYSGTCHRIENFASTCWLEKGPLTCGPLAEMRALLRCLAAARQFGCVGYGIESSGALLGFMILEPVHDCYVHAHFGGLQHGQPGLAEYFLFQIAMELNRHGCLYINDHEDLGLSGLRQFKKAWEPVRLLKKYCLVTEKPVGAIVDSKQSPQ